MTLGGGRAYADPELEGPLQRVAVDSAHGPPRDAVDALGVRGQPDDDVAALLGRALEPSAVGGQDFRVGQPFVQRLGEPKRYDAGGRPELRAGFGVRGDEAGVGSGGCSRERKGKEHRSRE